MRSNRAPRRPPIATLTAGAIVALLSSAGALLALPPDKDRWIQVQTAHFTFYSNASERRTLDLGRRLERFRAVLALSYQKFKVDPPVTTSVYVFRDDASLTPYKQRFNGRPITMGGLFASAPDGNYIEMNGDPGTDPLDIIYHEYIHHFLEANMHNVPAWFNEGVAECFGTFRADDKAASVGLTQSDHVLYLRQHGLMPLHDLFAITTKSPDYNEGERRGIFYAESWALVHYLMWDKPERRPQLGRFLDRLAGGEDPDEAFGESFETDHQTMENELRAHVRQARFLYSAVRLSDLKVDGTVQVTPMTREDVLVRLGDLLVHVHPDRAAEAEEHFAEARRINPSCAAAYAGLGCLRDRTERYDEAVALYEKALAIDPEDALACFHLGRCLTRRALAQPPPPEPGQVAPDIARAQGLFVRTIQLRPGFAEAYAEYGRTFLVEGGNLPSAINLLETARQMLPARTDIVVNLAMLYARKGDGARAHALVENVLAHMNDREALEAARSRLRSEDEWRSRAAQPIPGPRPSGDPTAGEAASEAPVGPDAGGTPSPPGGPGPAPDSVTEYNRQVAVYNKAVARANQRDYKGAIEILESLLKEAKDPDLRAQITRLLETLRKDAARLQKTRR